MKSLLEKISQLSQVEEEVNVTEAENKKPDKDGDGVPDWADKKDGEDDNADDEDKKEKVDEAIAIQADGQEAMALLDLLKLSGQKPASDCACGSDNVEGSGLEMEVEAEEDPVYVNSPDEKVSDISSAVPSGNDLHKEKDQFKHNYRGGDNPMAMEEIAKLEGKLKKMFESLSD